MVQPALRGNRSPNTYQPKSSDFTCTHHSLTQSYRQSPPQLCLHISVADAAKTQHHQTPAGCVSYFYCCNLEVLPNLLACTLPCQTLDLLHLLLYGISSAYVRRHVKRTSFTLFDITNRSSLLVCLVLSYCNAA